ncbi:MAG: 2-phosphosulfolactate phosphatase [Phycisphaerales bacterium]|nr:2-phosphosulfolactate phosphatase [Phycisphaerales bacterium]
MASTHQTDARTGGLRVHLLPAHVPAGALGGSTVIVIDALRASVTIAAALQAGACTVMPVLSVDEAMLLAGRLGASSPVVLGGERGGVRLPGFDLGNSPAEYTAESVGGRVLVFTTTNGTRALLHADGAARILVGSLPNRRAVCAAAAEHGGSIQILCAGTDGGVSMEDALTAGALVESLGGEGIGMSGDDTARLCLEAWRAAASSGEAGVLDAFRRSAGGRNLLELGMGSDIALCARADWLDVAPEFDVSTRGLRR